eukprot:COSAG06_NODE_4088_length_4587_cov_16.117157_2_plen_85_part_00
MSELLCPPPSVRLLLLAGLGNAFFQQATGVEAAVYYTPEVLETAGFTDEDSLLLATVRKTPLFEPFIHTNDLLPRQARDRHRKS